MSTLAKLKEKVLEKILEHTLALVVTPTLILGGTTVWVLMPILLSPLWTRVPAQTLQRVLGLAFLSIMILLAYVLVLRHKLKTSQKIFYGIFWDKHANAFCPACEAPLGGYGVYGMAKNPAFFCRRCKISVPIRSDEANFVSLVEAKQHVLEAW
jgi:hypothetical protein